jgi:hypothetical protein
VARQSHIFIATLLPLPKSVPEELIHRLGLESWREVGCSSQEDQL